MQPTRVGASAATCRLVFCQNAGVGRKLSTFNNPVKSIPDHAYRSGFRSIIYIGSLHHKSPETSRINDSRADCCAFTTLCFSSATLILFLPFLQLPCKSLYRSYDIDATSTFQKVHPRLSVTIKWEKLRHVVYIILPQRRCGERCEAFSRNLVVFR